MRQLTQTTLTVLGLVLCRVPQAAAQGGSAISLSVGVGPSIVDQAGGSLPSPGVGAFVRVTGRDRDAIALFGDVWLLTQGHTTIETAPCPPTVLCGGGSPGNTTVVVLAPALQAREGYERVSLLYRLGPTIDWFADRAPGSTAVTFGARAGLAIRTSRLGRGLLLSVDYFRAFRGAGRPRWFLPLTIGWQF